MIETLICTALTGREAELVGRRYNAYDPKMVRHDFCAHGVAYFRGHTRGAVSNVVVQAHPMDPAPVPATVTPEQPRPAVAAVAA